MIKNGILHSHGGGWLRSSLPALAAVLTLVLVLASPAWAGSEKGNKKCNDGRDNDRDGLIDAADPDCGGGDDTEGGTQRSLVFMLDDVFSDNVRSDGGSYSDSERQVKVTLGGQTAPNRPGFRVELKGAGKNPRQVTADFSCSGAAGLPDNCDLLPFTFPVTRSNASLGLTAYQLNCPEPLPLTGECPDVYTMAQTTQGMSFRVNFWSPHVFVEAASEIGGADSPNPGRCLSMLSNADRAAFVAAECGPESNCNVSVTAFDNGDINGAGDGDGENDEWHVVANNTVALMCDLQNHVVFGMTTLSFGAEAIKE